jgi:multidrug efflux pump subunit AcrA (membrane-fusion protein)
MTANVEILVAEKRGVLSVPAAAILKRDGKTVVRLPGTAGADQDRPVSTGITDGRRTEVLEGLAEGERVVVPNEASESRWRSQPPSLLGGPPRGR